MATNEAMMEMEDRFNDVEAERDVGIRFVQQLLGCAELNQDDMGPETRIVVADASAWAVSTGRIVGPVELSNKLEHDVARQKLIIEAVEEWAEMSEISVLLLGTDSDRHIYADAILGTITTPRPAVLYSREKVIEAMVRESDYESGGGTWEEMEEFYEYNTVRSLQYMREEDNPPIMVDQLGYV